MQSQNQKLLSHISEVETSKGALMQDIQDLRAKSDAAAQHNALLREKVQRMQRQLQVNSLGFYRA